MDLCWPGNLILVPKVLKKIIPVFFDFPENVSKVSIVKIDSIISYNDLFSPTP